MSNKNRMYDSCRSYGLFSGTLQFKKKTLGEQIGPTSNFSLKFYPILLSRLDWMRRERVTIYIRIDIF